MADVKYTVILVNKIAEGQDIRKVKKRLAALFKTDIQKINALFKKKASIIKKNVDFKTAWKYAGIVKKTGAICQIKASKPGVDKPPVSREDRAPSEKKTVGHERPSIKCPYCNYQIPAVEDAAGDKYAGLGECPACGVMIAEYAIEMERHREMASLERAVSQYDETTEDEETEGDKPLSLVELLIVIFNKPWVKRLTIAAIALVTLVTFLAVVFDRQPANTKIVSAVNALLQTNSMSGFCPNIKNVKVINVKRVTPKRFNASVYVEAVCKKKDPVDLDFGRMRQFHLSGEYDFTLFKNAAGKWLAIRGVVK